MLPLLLLGQLTMANAADMMLVSVDFDSAIICPIVLLKAVLLIVQAALPFPPIAQLFHQVLMSPNAVLNQLLVWIPKIVRYGLNSRYRSLKSC